MSESAKRHALWVSTSVTTRGGIATFVRTMHDTPLWLQWHIRHIATHRDGTIPSRVLAYLRAWPRILQEFLWHRPSLVHIHMASDGSFYRKSAIVWLAKVTRTPVVLHIHGAEFHRFHRESSRPMRRFIRHTIEAPDVVIALGTQWRTRITALAPAAEVVVVPNATHLARPVAQPKSDERIEVLFLGRVGARKGTFELIDTWSAIVSDPARAHLTIAGDGEVDRARQLVNEHAADGTVTVLGWVDPDQVTQLIEHSHVLVLPSHNEGQPMAILEALAHGLCVIATDVGGIADLIGDGCGMLIPVADPAELASALNTAITDPAQRSTLSINGFHRAAEEFDAISVAARLDEIYRAVVQ